MTGIILQVRLDSTRLPQKALLALSGEPVIVRVMETLSQSPADAYVLACDTDSESVFQPLAESCGFLCISGPKEDVLERFCRVIRKTGISTVLRATGDNPFLFYDAAIASLERFSAAKPRIRCTTRTSRKRHKFLVQFQPRRWRASPRYEHVGPSYNHPDGSTVRETARGGTIRSDDDRYPRGYERAV